MPRRNQDEPVIAKKKKAFHDYNIIERFEAGVQLVGTEVKSCRAKSITMTDSYVTIRNNQAWLENMHIAPYGFGNRFNHVAKQTRRLLLHKNEILKLAQWLGTKGGTLIPLKVYLKQGLVKIEIAYCQGKTHSDKRETLRKRQDDLDMRRALKR